MTSFKQSFTVLAVAVGGIAIGALARSAAADQPDMESALQSLQAAKSSLESASDHHGGHRVKALKATDLAIAEVKAGIAWAEQHPIGPGPKGPGPKGPQPKN
jgi:hypothetical protein